MREGYEERIGAPWWLIVPAPVVMLVVVPVPSIGWFGVATNTAIVVGAVFAAIQIAVAVGVGTSILIADGMLRTSTSIALGPVAIPLGRERHLPVTAIHGVRLLRGKAVTEVRRRLTSEPTRAALYGNRIGDDPGSTVGAVPWRHPALHLEVIGADGRPQEWLVSARDPEGFVGALGHPTPPPVLEQGPVPLPDGSPPAPDPIGDLHPRQCKRGGANGQASGRG